MVTRSIRRVSSLPWIFPSLLALGIIIFLSQAVAYAFMQTSLVDEGGYLYLGWLYNKGHLHLFQDFGPPRWYAPLAYLIPGKVEAWFGPGLLTGRVFSVACSLLMLLPLYLLVRRMGGKWWGLAVIWCLALTPIGIQVYSLALTQALVACLLAWVLYFTLGEKRPGWQVVLGSLLAGALVMTRHTMVPILPILVWYVFWEHGKRSGWVSMAGCLVPVVIIHAIYWPNILQLWAVWLPASIFPFLQAFRFPQAAFLPASEVGFFSRLLPILLGFRFHYFSLVAFIASIFLWPRRKGWGNPSHRRAAVFLTVLFITLTILHALATITTSDQAGACLYCFTPYLSFFDFTALLLLVVVSSSWNLRHAKWLQGFFILVFLALSASLGFASYDRFGPWLLRLRFPAFTRGWDPRLWQPFITLWDILSNKYHQDYWNSRVYISALAGLVIGSLLLIIIFVMFSRFSRRKDFRILYTSQVIFATLILGFWLSPLMGGTYRQDRLCPANIPRAYQKVGSELSSLIPPGSRVDWEASNAVPLLYLPEVIIHPSQVYALFSFRLGGDPIELEKHGLWNETLANSWRSQADVIVTEMDKNLLSDLVGDLDVAGFSLSVTSKLNPCDDHSSLVVYHRNP